MLRLLAIMLFSLAVLLAGAALGPRLFTDLRPDTSLANRMFNWDGPWYDEIAGTGYQWTPGIGAAVPQHQDVAFFPLYALIDWTAMKLTGNVSAALLISPGLLFGLWSIVAFDRLVRQHSPGRPSTWATLCFALWPGSCFLLMGYPTGLINLCVVNALFHYLRGERWRAAAWCGLGTAAAPTVVFVAAGLCVSRALAWLRDRHPPTEIPAIIGFGLVTVAGLLCFLAFLLVKFHDPFAFIEAQSAWGRSPPVGQRLVRLFDPARYFGAYGRARDVFRFLVSSAPKTSANRQLTVLEYEQALSFAAVVLATAALIAASLRRRARVVPLAGWMVLAGYLWFVGTTDQFLVDGLRLLYPATAIFLAFGDWAAASRTAGCLLLGGFTILAFVQAGLASTGYPVP